MGVRQLRRRLRPGRPPAEAGLPRRWRSPSGRTRRRRSTPGSPGPARRSSPAGCRSRRASSAWASPTTPGSPAASSAGQGRGPRRRRALRQRRRGGAAAPLAREGGRPRAGRRPGRRLRRCPVRRDAVGPADDDAPALPRGRDRRPADDAGSDRRPGAAAQPGPLAPAGRCANPAAPTPLRPGRADRGERGCPGVALAVACRRMRPWRRLLGPGGVGVSVRRRPWGRSPREWSAKPDASIATTAELAPAAGPGGLPAEELAASPLSALTSWNRYQVGRVIEGVILIWLVGTVVLFWPSAAETRASPASRNRSGASGPCYSAAWTTPIPPTP